MGCASKKQRVCAVGLVLASMASMGCQIDIVNADGQQRTDKRTAAASAQNQGGLVIENDSELPDTYPRAAYELRFRARGGVPQLHWRLESGALPPGMRLEDDGLLHGQAERKGEFQFTLSVRDGGKPQAAVQKGFLLRVRSALSLKWKVPAHVNGNRIEGSVAISNTTPDNIDLTFVVMAVAPEGRATAIGYQHFVLARGTLEKELPFGETLPHGTYFVHVDAVGEAAAKNLIYRDRMEAPALEVTVGP